VDLLKKTRRQLRLGWVFWCAFLLAAPFLSMPAMAGPYPPAAGEPGSTAIDKDDSAFVAWATGWQDYEPGSEVDAAFQTPEEAVGKASGTASDVVSLGRGGQITMTFNTPIENGEGWDFAVFENAFSDTFLELAYVEVSADGKTFVRFDNDSLTPEPVAGFGAVDPTNIDGFAGKYRQGYGTPFDLEDVGLDQVSYVRLIDIVGDGADEDTSGHVIYDPYPTVGSAGLDLDAVGVSNGAAYPGGEISAPEPNTAQGPPPADGEAGIGDGGGTGCFIATVFGGV
jgi:hypothetical protein